MNFHVTTGIPNSSSYCCCPPDDHLQEAGHSFWQPQKGHEKCSPPLTVSLTVKYPLFLRVALGSWPREWQEQDSFWGLFQSSQPARSSLSLPSIWAKSLDRVLQAHEKNIEETLASVLGPFFPPSSSTSYSVIFKVNNKDDQDVHFNNIWRQGTTGV